MQALPKLGIPCLSKGGSPSLNKDRVSIFAQSCHCRYQSWSFPCFAQRWNSIFEQRWKCLTGLVKRGIPSLRSQNSKVGVGLGSNFAQRWNSMFWQRWTWVPGSDNVGTDLHNVGTSIFEQTCKCAIFEQSWNCLLIRFRISCLRSTQLGFSTPVVQTYFMRPSTTASCYHGPKPPSKPTPCVCFVAITSTSHAT